MAPDERPKAGAHARRPSRPASRNPLIALYELFGDTGFALFVIITLAVASILGVIITDQIPFRGEMARMRFPDRTGDLSVWLMINVLPEHPFRSLLFRTLLALLSLSLLACVIKRWRRQWRLAFILPDPAAGAFDGPQSLVWRTAAALAPADAIACLRGRGFALRRGEDGETTLVAGSRFGIARLGSVCTHVGFLLLVVGGLIMASTGTSGIAWLTPGESAWITGTDARIELQDFRIETAPDGQVADYVSAVRLMRDDTLVRTAEIEVNRPLRYRGRSVYQSSYRADPTRVRSLTLVFDPSSPDASAAAGATGGDAGGAGATGGAANGGATSGAADGAAAGSRASMPPRASGGMMMPPHEPTSDAMRNPITVVLTPGERSVLAGTCFSAEIDTFLADFRVESGSFRLGSTEPRNPAVRVRFFRDGEPAGSNWYFLMHPDMPVGTGPGLPVRFADYDPHLQTGLEIATHPGAGGVWAGFAAMTLGTLLSFLLRHERVWLRIRRPAGAPGEWELALVHAGATPRVRETAGADAAPTELGARLLRRWPPAVPVAFGAGRGRSTETVESELDA